MKDRIKVEKGRAEGRHVGKSKEMEEMSDVAFCFRVVSRDLGLRFSGLSVLLSVCHVSAHPLSCFEQAAWQRGYSVRFRSQAAGSVLAGH